MTLSRALQLAQKAHLRCEMEIFLAHLLQCSRCDVLSRAEEEIPVEKLSELQKGWIRLQDGLPVAYLTYEKEFYGLNFYVDERVLIPRPETELLVDLALKKTKKVVLEVGTGCGAVACSIKRNRPELRVMATDVDPDVLHIANKNCVQLEVDVQLLCADLLESVPKEPFDTLVANLPYIGLQSHAWVDEKVRKHEPRLALFGGSDGLQLYTKLFDQIREQNRPFQTILGEMGFSQGEDIRLLCLEKLPGYRFQLFNDLQGLPRHFLLESA